MNKKCCKISLFFDQSHNFLKLNTRLRDIFCSAGNAFSCIACHSDCEAQTIEMKNKDEGLMETPLERLYSSE